MYSHCTNEFEKTYTSVSFINRHVPFGAPTDDNACVIGVVRFKIKVKDIMYQIFRLLGRGHEHARPDRDQYITIRWENILPGDHLIMKMCTACDINFLL